MHFFTALVAAFAVAACAAPTTTTTKAKRSPKIQQYDPVGLYQVIPFPNGEELLLNGTLSEVYAQALEINPNYEADWAANLTASASASLAVRGAGNDEDERGNTLSTRAEKRPADLHCDGIWANGVASAVVDGIEYLRTHFKTLKPGLVAWDCHTVSCGDETAIRWCNDSDKTRILEWDNIADGAQVIYNYCQKQYEEVGGWLGHNDHWRVFVDKGDC